MKQEQYASLFIRLGLGFVIFWIGLGLLVFRAKSLFFDELMQNLPLLRWAFPLYAGVFSLVIGLMLIAGLFTQYVSVIAVVYFLSRILFISFGVESGFWHVWQDIGLIATAIGLALVGSNKWSIDELMNQ